MTDAFHLAIAQARADEAAARVRREVLEHELGAPVNFLDGVAERHPPARKPVPNRRVQAVAKPSAEELSKVTPLNEKAALAVAARKGMVEP